MIKINRPSPDTNKISTKHDFELCYLRHQYFRRAKYNPTEEEMSPFMKIVENLTRNTFFTYYNLFKWVGMYQDDILNIGRVHLVSFLGLYSMEQMKNKRKEWMVNFYIDNRRDPNEKDFEQKNKANFTLFLKQRMEDLVRVCRQKSRNIKGKNYQEFDVFCGKENPPKSPKKLLRDYQEHGYKKIDFSVFKSIRKKANVNHDATMFKFSGLWYVAIPLEQSNLEIEDIVGAGCDPYRNEHNMRPDDLYEEKENRNLFILFDSKSKFKKAILLKKFIAKNKKRVQYKEEVSTARKILRSLGD